LTSKYIVSLSKIEFLYEVFYLQSTKIGKCNNLQTSLTLSLFLRQDDIYIYRFY